MAGAPIEDNPGGLARSFDVNVIFYKDGAPRPIVERMKGEFARALRSPGVAPKFAAQIGMEILATSAEAFVEFRKVEQERPTRIIRENGINAD